MTTITLESDSSHSPPFFLRATSVPLASAKKKPKSRRNQRFPARILASSVEISQRVGVVVLCNYSGPRDRHLEARVRIER